MVESGIRRMVLDVLKPNEPSIIDLATVLEGTPGVEAVDVTVTAVDRKVEKVKITLVGKHIRYATVKEAIERLGASIHSIDRVASGKRLVDEAPVC